MNKKEYKEAFFKLLKTEVITNNNVLSDNEKIKEVKGYIFEYEKGIDYDISNKGKEWTDDELKIVLSFAPTKENCIKLAKAFKRGYGSIEQIFRWAVVSEKELETKDRLDDKFVHQIKKIYKEVGWRV